MPDQRRIGRRTLLAATLGAAAGLGAAAPATAAPRRTGVAAAAPRVTATRLADGPVVLEQAHRVNRRGQVLGAWRFGDYNRRVALWDRGRITVLPPLTPGGTPLSGDLNDRGQVLGVEFFPGDPRAVAPAVLWERGVPRAVDLGAPGRERFAQPGELNDHGHFLLRTDEHLYLYRDGRPTLIDVPMPSVLGAGHTYGLNNRGQVVGVALGGVGGFVWQDGTTTPLGGGAEPRAINERGQVAADAARDGHPRAVRWDAGTLTDLGTLGGTSSQVSYLGRPLNDQGDVVGASYLPGDRVRRPVLWADGRTTDLGGFGGDEGWAVAVNNRREVIGFGLDEDGVQRGFLWRAGRLVEIPPPDGYTGCSLHLIADDGAIYGSARTADGSHDEAFRWTVS
ncbi:hypothetical protein RKE29_07780 [Streptomyces sp. B1866]|uniref:hypothetical protein n=1 Tax=Streptomyces sp. B1866 TaxID=3075431 RepID=UPI0028926CA4|nr:hypothetical protein [Streptomyces sp. B1866]MDT3396541.1 hypothetical protein [Streptomyces sp. B1866]